MDNIVVLKNNAQNKDLKNTLSILNLYSKGKDGVMGGEVQVDPIILNHEQKEVLRGFLGCGGIFTDGTKDKGDINLYLTTDIDLGSDGNLVAFNYSYIIEDCSINSTDNIEYGIIFPTVNQVKKILTIESD